jgi:hypothetical protein
VATKLGPGRGREGLLSHFGALSMLGLFASWATTLIAAFGVLEWAQQPGSKNVAAASLFEELYAASVWNKTGEEFCMSPRDQPIACSRVSKLGAEVSAASYPWSTC